MSRRTSLTKAWNSVGALTRPNGKTQYSKRETQWDTSPKPHIRAQKGNIAFREVAWCPEGDRYCNRTVDEEAEMWPGNGWKPLADRGIPPGLQTNHQVYPETQERQKRQQRRRRDSRKRREETAEETAGTADTKQLIWQASFQERIVPLSQLICGLCWVSHGWPKIIGVKEIVSWWFPETVRLTGIVTRWTVESTLPSRAKTVVVSSKSTKGVSCSRAHLSSMKFPSAPESMSAEQETEQPIEEQQERWYESLAVRKEQLRSPVLPCLLTSSGF